ncbi:MAG: 3-deoxy-D-manno-octulosonic acid transferase [Betaproteobacteria bacterium]
MLRLAYSLLLFLSVPLIMLRLLARGFRQRGYWQNVGERFGSYFRQPLHGSLWVHAVSVGEMRAAQPLIARLRSDYPGRAIVVSCMTATGRDTAQELYADTINCVYLPYDFSRLHRRFIAHFRPAVLLIMETEIWPNLLAACAAAEVPTVLVNGRLSEQSRRGYARVAPVRALIREALQSLRAVAAQSPADAARLASLGARHPVVTGNIKFDVPSHPALVARGLAWRKSLPSGKRVLLAASTRDGEEKLLLEAYRQALDAEARGHILLVLVPRHPQRFDAVHQVILAAGLSACRRSDRETAPDDVDVWLGDSMGEMAAYIALCDVAFIGGSLLPLGGQNLIEACAQGKPVVMGPSTYNFADAVRLAVEAGAMRQGDNADAVVAAADEWLKDEARRGVAARAALAFARAHAGATEKTMGLIAPLLSAGN